MYPKPFEKLIKNFSSLPSIGPKHAERLVLFLFKKDKEFVEDFSKNIIAIKGLRSCKACYNISEEENCQICKDKKRDTEVICVVEEPLDILSIERTGMYRGRYHVLGGVISMTDTDRNLKIPELIKRVEDEKIKEVILATNPTTEGDATAFYLKRKLQPLKTKTTRLGRGLSTGSDLEYADELTLSESLNNRREI